MSPNSIKRIDNPRNEIEAIKDWVDTWDYAFSPTGQNEFSEFIRKRPNSNLF